jgi:parvulin-like peptidyl-prolyl isomerase
MLENMRKSGASLFVWVIFGILIAVFVINFGPQSGGGQQGCSGGGKQTMVTVGSSSVDDTGFRLAANVAGALIPADDDYQRYEVTLELLIRRELLAQEAERRGLRVPESYVDHVISQGELHFAGEPRGQFRQVFINEDDVFDYKRFKRFLQGWGLSVGAYKRNQSREIMATTMARILTGSVPVSREEAFGQFVNARTTVTFEAVRFDPRRYGDALLLTDADIDRYVAAHEAEVKATYSDALYKGKKQVHVRRIKLAKTATAADKPADAADPAKAKLEALRADITGGKKAFADAAKASDADERWRVRGGDWGWHDEGLPTLPEPALNDALKKLAKGDVSEVIEAGDGFYLLTVDDRREGDLTFDQVKRELGEKLARDAWGKEAAKRAALNALEQARSGAGKNLRELFPSTTSGEKTGRAGGQAWESEDVPVAWMQDPPAAGTGAGTAPGADAGTAPAPAAAPAKPEPLKASDEQLPPLAKNMDAPAVESFGPISRSGRTPLGESLELSRALFDELTSGMIAPRVFEVRETKTAPSPKYVVVQMLNKQLADKDEFDKQADLYVASLSRQRGEELLETWLGERCAALAAQGKIKPHRDLVTRRDAKGNPLPVSYAPCMSMAVPQ